MADEPSAEAMDAAQEAMNFDISISTLPEEQVVAQFAWAVEYRRVQVRVAATIDAATKAAYARGLKDAARACEAQIEPDGYLTRNEGARDCAAAIRALLLKENDRGR